MIRTGLTDLVPRRIDRVVLDYDDDARARKLLLMLTWEDSSRDNMQTSSHGGATGRCSSGPLVVARASYQARPPAPVLSLRAHQDRDCFLNCGCNFTARKVFSPRGIFPAPFTVKEGRLPPSFAGIVHRRGSSKNVEPLSSSV